MMSMRGMGASALLCVGMGVGGCTVQEDAERSADPSIATRSAPVSQSSVSDAEPMPALEGSTLALGSTEARSASVTLQDRGVMSSLTRIAASDQIQRAEAVWGDARNPNEPLALTTGSVVTATFITSLDLGGAAGTGVWAVAWQLIGPEGGGSWPGPPLALTVSDDTWLLGGGEGHPDGSRESYKDTGVPFRDGQPVEWLIQVYLERGAGSVDVWADGIQVIEGWSPPGGTMYPDQSFVIMKNGLYTGGNGGNGARTTMVVSDARAAVVPPAAVSSDTSFFEGA